MMSHRGKTTCRAVWVALGLSLVSWMKMICALCVSVSISVMMLCWRLSPHFVHGICGEGADVVRGNWKGGDDGGEWFYRTWGNLIDVVVFVTVDYEC